MNRDPGTEPFELFALRYATNSGRTPSDNFAQADPHEFASDLDYFVWVARRSDRTVLIDTGFGEEAAVRRRRTLLRRPKDALSLVGLDAAAIEDVVITHLHFDHAGTLGDFPRARIHVQDREASFATGRCMCHRAMREAFDVTDVQAFVGCLYEGRACFHDGDSELDPSLTLHRIGGHTAGLQAARVWTRRGWVVLASDASHLYANMEGRRAFPQSANLGEMLEGFERLYRLASSPDHVIPGHDPLVMQRYRAPDPALEGLAVRLDDAEFVNGTAR